MDSVKRIQFTDWDRVPAHHILRGRLVSNKIYIKKRLKTQQQSTDN